MTPTFTTSVSANLEWTEYHLGGEVLEIDSYIAVGTSAGLLLPNNPDRVGLVIVNNGTTTCYVSYLNAVGANIGIPIVGNGGALSFKLRDDFTLIARQWNAISPSGATNLTTFELIRIVRFGPPKEAPYSGG